MQDYNHEEIENPLKHIGDRHLLEIQSEVMQELNQVSQSAPNSDRHCEVFAAYMMVLYELKDRKLEPLTIN